MRIPPADSADALSSISPDMGKLYDLAEAIKDKLDANVTELADVDVIVNRGRDIQQNVLLSLQKVGGLAVVVMVTGGEDDTPDRLCDMALRLETSVSVTIWVNPTFLRSASTGSPLTSGARNPDDVLEAVLKYLHNLNVFDVADIEGGPGVLRVVRWQLLNTDSTFHVYEIQAETVTQL